MGLVFRHQVFGLSAGLLLCCLTVNVSAQSSGRDCKNKPVSVPEGCYYRCNYDGTQTLMCNPKSGKARSTSGGSQGSYQGSFQSGDATYPTPAPTTPSVPTYSPPSSAGGGGNAGAVLEILGTFLDIWASTQQQEAEQASDDAAREIERMEAEEEAKTLAEEQGRARIDAKRRQEEAEDRVRRQTMANPFATNMATNTDSAKRGAGTSNPFRTEAPKGTSKISKAQCLSDLQRALLATKKAYLSNTKGATTLNDKSLPADFEIPRASCPPVSKVDLHVQRRSFEDARALQYCASQAFKCAIVLVSSGADCQASMNSCQDKFVGNLK